MYVNTLLCINVLKETCDTYSCLNLVSISRNSFVTKFGWKPYLLITSWSQPHPSQRLRLRRLLKTDSIQRELTTVYGANAGQRVIKPCSSRKNFLNRFFYEMVSFSALCEFSKMFTRPTWQNQIFFKFFCLIVLDLLGLKLNTVRSNLGESKQG